MAATEANECSICCQPFTSSRRKPIKCQHPGCEDICCLECFETGLLTNDSTVPRCMFCDNSIQLSHIRDHCSLSFCNKKFMEKRVENEMGSWKSRLPDWQDHVILIHAKREHESLREDFRARADEYFKKGHAIMREFYSIPEPQIDHIKGNKENKLSFIQRCPKEGCTGFLSASWKCGICENFFCSKCHVEKLGKNDDTHVCDEDTVASINAIKKDSKPCPKCGNRISKISGCDQMWCPAKDCNTAFSYRTGKIETGHIHNPHYYEFLRNQNGGDIPRAPGDLPPCEQVPRVYTIAKILEDSSRMYEFNDENKKKFKDLRDYMYRFYRERFHVEDTYLGQLRLDFDEEYQDLGVKYLMKDSTEEEVKSNIKRIVKKKEKNTEIGQVYRLFTTVSSENLKNIYEILSTHPLESRLKPVEDEVRKIQNLVDYCNDNLTSLSKKFKNSVKLIEKFDY